jgi:uncharacterized protein (DUF2336 family)
MNENTPKMTLGTLSKDDISRLVGDHTTHVQMGVIEQLTELYTAEGENALSPQEVRIANDIFRLLLTRASVLVRAMLAMNLSQTSKLPPELARQMANDVDEVAAPVLQYTEVLSDDDLIAIIRSLADTEKLRAIAKREKVSEKVSEALVSTSIDPVVSELIKNEGADIKPQTFEHITLHFQDNAEVIESLFLRNSLPPNVVDKVVSHISEAMRKDFERKYGNLSEISEINKALDQSLELTRLKMLGLKSTDEDLLKLIKQLDENGNLPPVSALVTGNLQLFEVSLSRSLQIPVSNVHILLQDPSGFETIYRKARLPENLFDACALAVRAIREMEEESIQKTGKKFICTSTQMMEHMRRISAGKTVDNLNRFFELMKHCIGQTGVPS